MQKSIILDIFSFSMQRPFIKRPLVMASGGFDPIHPGHISYLMEASLLGELVVVVNGDWFLKQKKGSPFMDLDSRCEVVAGIRGVSWVIPYEVENMTVNKALQMICPNTFVKGGDRCDETSIPEWDTCIKMGIKIITGIGYSKKWSSSDYLEKWDKRHD
jgi:D-beta-D-heptose 7-phosphate kinase/D-beta-D-heptose 1-phosphate adenosyltransferase